MSDKHIEKKHILVVSNEPRVLAELKMELMDSFDVSIAANSATVLTALDKYDIKAIVNHIGESRENAFSIIADTSESARKKCVPILLLAETDNTDVENDAFLAGAADYAVRRQGGSSAFIRRINNRIHDGENERIILNGDCGLQPSSFDREAMLAGKTILIVDDVELNRALIEGMLCEIGGLTLDFAEDGEEAVRKYTEAPGRYALILMDVQMPVMDGIGATIAIRGLAFGNAREIPIIALTAGVEEEDIASYLEAGMNDFLKKPMDYNLLLNMVTKYCV